MRKNAMWLLAVLTAASVVGVTGSVVVAADGPASERPIPSAAGDLPVVVSGQGEVGALMALTEEKGSKFDFLRSILETPFRRSLCSRMEFRSRFERVCWTRHRLSSARVHRATLALQGATRGIACVTQS